MNRKYTIKQLRKVLVQQHDESDCGVAALQTIINWHGGTSFSEEIRIASGTNNSGTTLLGLYQAAAEIGLDPKGCEIDIDYLIQLKEPCLLHVQINPQRFHYVVYLGWLEKNKSIIIGDPSSGIIFLSKYDLLNLWTTKAALILTPGGNFKKQNKKGFNEKRKWFVQQLGVDIPLLSVSIVLGCFISIIGLSTAIFSQKLIDQFLPNRNSKYIIIGILLLFIILFFRSFLSYLRNYIMLKQSKGYNERLTGFFIEKIFRLPKSFYDSRKTGDMIARLNDTQRIQRNISFIMGNVVIDALLSIISMITLFFYSIQSGFIMLCFTPLVMWLIYSYTSKFVKGQKDVMSVNRQQKVDS